ncbi:hypothetical protein GCM10010172_03350 [Paractinoplanes ferrugineus]|uniref:Tetratricopeptide repeat protein n=1 Tax=Paractinoplanes ferrugineus TaxID=113564 RepID=A0A919MIJ1_9ACTN|nr:tetratricopeptide repeat protein [Actinoplanes ferrugineus]GIE13740.1 hypothetical protein Afe05nite_55800 [Actinoplanes ferrugineus]
MTSHHWIRGGSRADRTAELGRLGLPAPLATVSAHRRLRGPYTAAGTLIRLVAADALRRDPELGPDHHIALLTSTPELAGQVPPIKVALELTAASGARTRYQARLHSLRVSHGLVDFLLAYLRGLPAEPRVLVVEDVSEADPTDLEFLAVLVRRVPADLLTVVVGSGPAPLADPPGPVSVSLPAALRAHTTAHDAAGGTALPPVTGDLADAFVDSDGTTDDPRALEAYEKLAQPERAARHDRRIEVLRELGERSLEFGAIPFHAEHGSDPAGAGTAALRVAQLNSKNLGLYHSAVDFGLRGRRLVPGGPDDKLWWHFTGDATTSLSALGRAEEVELIYAELRMVSTDSEMHMHGAYATAMLYARHFDDSRRDPRKAREWLHVAIAISTLLPDPKERAFYTVFNRNGLALVETREGRPDRALELLNSGMATLDRELAPGEQLLHRTGLRYNRAQVFIMTGRLTEALADLDTVIEVDPNFHDHYFNRGNVLHRLGRRAEAVEDYGRALALSPPYPEVFYNRGDARAELGDLAGAVEDFSRVIELDPDNADAWLNRAAMRHELGDDDGAWADVTAGLAVRPDGAHLHGLRGRLLAGRGDTDAAWASLTAAVEHDPGLASAWATRGMLAFDNGDLDRAVADLDRSVSLLDNPEIRFNRGVALQEAGRYEEAGRDFAAVLDATGDEDARARLDECRRAASTAFDDAAVS